MCKYMQYLIRVPNRGLMLHGCGWDGAGHVSSPSQVVCRVSSGVWVGGWVNPGLGGG